MNVVVPSALKNLFRLYVCICTNIYTVLKHPIFTFFSSSFFLYISRSSPAHFTKTTTHSRRTDIMKKTVKLMISISNKSNPITTSTSLILNEIMRCLHQHRTLISWRATITQPIPTQIDITIIIIDIKMPHQVHKVMIVFQFSMIYWFYILPS